jgi:hypothetical protein
MVDTARMAEVASTDDTPARMARMDDTARMAVARMDDTVARTDDTAAVEGMPEDGTAAEGMPADGTAAEGMPEDGMAVGAGMPVGGTPAGDTEYTVMA